MTYRELAERHDIGILLYLRALRAPWSPESHASFSYKVRKSVKTVWLCVRRKQYPVEVAERICTFLHRDWWQDEDIECWDFYCRNRTVTGDALAAYENKEHGPSIFRTIKCPKCMIPRYCDRTCRTCALRNGHKSNCSKLQFSGDPVENDERQLYVDILGSVPKFLTSDASTAQPSGSFMAVDMEIEDEESSWETIESGDEADDLRESPTKAISQFFEKLRERRAAVLRFR